MQSGPLFLISKIYLLCIHFYSETSQLILLTRFHMHSSRFSHVKRHHAFLILSQHLKQCNLHGRNYRRRCPMLLTLSQRVLRNLLSIMVKSMMFRSILWQYICYFIASDSLLTHSQLSILHTSFSGSRKTHQGECLKLRIYS